MLTRRESRLSQLMLVVQVLFSMILFLAVQKLFDLNVFYEHQNVLFLCQIALVWSYFMYKLRLGIVFRETGIFHMINGYAAIVIIGWGIFSTEIVLFRDQERIHSIIVILLFSILDLSLLIAFKLLFYYIMLYLRTKGYNSRRVIIMADVTSIAFVDSFLSEKDKGYKIVGVVSPDAEIEIKHPGALIITDQDELKKYIASKKVDDVFYCLPVNSQQYNLQRFTQEMDKKGVNLHIMQHTFVETETDKEMEIKIRRKAKDKKTEKKQFIYLKIKSVFDVVFSATVLVVFSPLIALIILLIKLEDGGSALIKQDRIGQNGRRFTGYKFRTMIEGAEEINEQINDKLAGSDPVFKIKNDPRLTKFGRVLRYTSLDELPQFFNVIRGDMSVVGPRPSLLREVQRYERKYLRRLRMKPGLTCSWQVWGLHRFALDKWMKMDLEYVENWSLLLDFKIMLSTIGIILRAKGH